ncbi:MAG TPA: LysM peptidoglycan-binding domain-containing protein [Burkholderiales bacterium]|nr:LysM peptidoglycan-binding domain-containing protein [Burkholderiales bacterium]
MTPWLPALAAETGALRDDAPESYTVVRGDTLWSISGRFLKDPWKWPEVWKMNQEQIRNPHRIYPGDVIVLDRAGQQLRLVQQGDGAGGTVKLSPKVRVEPLKDGAVPSIPPSVIEPFLSRPLVVGLTELDGYPFILATQENRVAIGAGSIAYVEGITPEMGNLFQLFRRGDALVDPETNEILGYQGVHLGEARVIKSGVQATIEITKSVQEIYVGDRLIPASKEQPTFAYMPRAPWKPVRGRIVSTYGNLGETGPAGIVALSRGSKDGLEVGHVLALYRSQSTAQFEMRMSPLFGRQGLAGSNAPRNYYSERLLPRDASIGDTLEGGKPIRPEDAAALPDERYGLVMVFRTFERAAFGLVMQSSRPVSVNDLATNP